MEADFQREYGINLVQALGGMTFRRFVSLLLGLSGESRILQAFSEHDEKITDHDEAEREFLNFVRGGVS